MTKTWISAELVKAGLDPYLVDSFWFRNEAHVPFYDLDRADHTIITGLIEACGEETDKGFFFVADEI